MLKEKIVSALNEQLNREFHSAYIYLGMSAYASREGFNGAAKWFFAQYQEENVHGMKLFKYMDEQGATIDLGEIKKVPTNFDNIQDAFAQALDHEQKMTNWLNELSDLAFTEKDHATYNLLQWYVTEQVEEEALFNEILDKFKIVGGNGHGLYSIDKELGARTFSEPA